MSGAEARQAQAAEGYCAQSEVCVCGGDLPAVREGCSNWHAGVPSTVQAERDRWVDLVARIGIAVRCLYSVTPNGNEHIVRAVERLAAGLPPELDPTTWPMRGVRVDGETVVISVKGGNDAARWLCGELVSLITEPKT